MSTINDFAGAVRAIKKLQAEVEDLSRRLEKHERVQRKAIKADHYPHDQRPIVGGEHSWMA